MSRRKIFAGNWKMYKTSGEATELLNGIVKGLENIGNKEVVVFPPAVYIREIVNLCKNTSVNVGIQNIYFEKEGAFTGEISPLMAADSGVRYVLIGHSERRHIFRETDEEVNKKIKAVFKYGLEPVVCVGELLEERESGVSESVVKRQVELAFSNIDPKLMTKTIIAYEPVWAIGTGKVATPDIADSMHKLIRNIIKNLFNEKIANDIPILYGGSVKPENIAELYAKENIDGVLVGGASLKINSFLDIIHIKNN
jgi:triosephosphate isomerase (TIM)